MAKTTLHDVPAALVQLVNLIMRNLAPVLARYRITPQQWSVLAAVANAEEDPSLAAVSRQMMVSKQNMTGMIARLESLGLIRRIEDPTDLRASMLQLTRKGKRVIVSAGPVYDAWTEGLLGRLSENDRRAFVRSLDQLTQNLAHELKDER
ncbi:MAG TPA: MarR family transcriptional regulator [Thermoanaerobaculia bacterium]|nr:MarR family transcriptional regulator [Thermoanaerobaculia bacterium]